MTHLRAHHLQIQLLLFLTLDQATKIHSVLSIPVTRALALRIKLKWYIASQQSRALNNCSNTTLSTQPWQHHVAERAKFFCDQSSCMSCGPSEAAYTFWVLQYGWIFLPPIPQLTQYLTFQESEALLIYVAVLSGVKSKYYLTPKRVRDLTELYHPSLQSEYS